MSSHKIHGRRRAVPARTSPLAAVSKAVADNAAGAGRQAAVIAAASGLVLTSGIAANAAEAPLQRDAAPASTLETASQAGAAPLMADSTVKISFDRPAVTTAPAPVIEKAAAPVEAPQRAAAVQAPAAKAQITVQPQAAPGSRRGSPGGRRSQRDHAFVGVRTVGYHPGLHAPGGKGPGRGRHPCR